jgi:N-acetyltransferase
MRSWADPVPFAQIRQDDGRAVGCTAYWDLRYWPDRTDLCAIEIGWTWLARNERSRRAIERLGARFEGVLRQWSPSHAPGEEGQLRDSAMFSVLVEEWPSTKDALRRRLGR